MKSKSISDPIVVEIFRVEQGKQSVDTKMRQLDGVDLLQNTMLNYEPDLYNPEVLIKTSMDAPLIRNRIQELEVEEWQNTTALFAELHNLDYETKDRLGKTPPMHRAISIDKRNGKLVGVALIGDDLPRDVAADILEKAFFQKSLKHLMIFHQESVSFSNPAMRFGTSNEQTKELMGAIENYILQAINSKKEKSPISFANEEFQSGSNEAPSQTQIPVIKKRKTNPPPTIRMKPTPKNTVTARTKVLPAIPLQSIQPVKINEKTLPDKQLSLKTGKEKIKPDNQTGQETVDEKWFVSLGSRNWKERKNRDRNIINLTERIIRLSKSNDTPPRELIVSYLASLSTPQYEFLEQLINCFSEKTDANKEETTKKEQPQQRETLEKKATEPPPENLNKTDQQEEIMTEPIKPKEPVVIESAITNESILLDPELEEFKGISEEEKALHFKILDYQKKHNVSYDHAASVVLK